MRIVVGRVGRAHGVRGDVAVDVRTDDPEVRFAAGSSVFTAESGPAALTLAGSRWHSGRLLVRFEGVADRAAAEALTGTMLYRGEDDRVAEESAWYDHDIIGCTALVEGSPVGSVVDVLHLPAQDLLSIELTGGGARLVPLVAEFVPDIDIDGRTVRIRDVPGLLFDAAEPE